MIAIIVLICAFVILAVVLACAPYEMTPHDWLRERQEMRRARRG